MTDLELIQAVRCCVSSPKRDGCRNTCVFFNGDINCCIPEMGKAVADRLEALLAENELLKAQVPKWRPVSEPPESGCDVLAYRDDGVESRIYAANYENGVWYDCIFNRDDEHTTHWMSLPEPPSCEEGTV